MKKKAETNISSIVFAMLILGFLVLGGTKFIIDMAQPYSNDVSTDVNKLQDLVKNNSEIENQLSKISESQNNDPNEENDDRSFWAKTKDKIADRFEDTLFGKAFSTAQLIGDTFSMFSKFVLTFGGIFEIPDWAIMYISLAIGLSIVMALIYFFRSGK